MHVEKSWVAIVRGLLIIALLVPMMMGLSIAARPAVAGGEASRPDVIIDPGHGGVDGGAVGVTGTVEKELNLAVSLKLKAELEAEGYSVLMIRSTDISIHDESAKTIRQKKASDLKNRLAIAREYPDSLFVSVHMNSYTSEGVNGTMIYFGNNNTQSKVLAEHIMAQIRILQPGNGKQLKKAGSNLFLMSNAPNPAVLVECGFLSNRTEEAALKTEDYQAQMARHIAGGIKTYLENKYFGG